VHRQYLYCIHPPIALPHLLSPHTGTNLPDRTCSTLLFSDLVKIATQGVYLWHFHVYMYYNLNWFHFPYFSPFYLSPLPMVISTGLKFCIHSCINCQQCFSWNLFIDVGAFLMWHIQAQQYCGTITSLGILIYTGILLWKQLENLSSSLLKSLDWRLMETEIFFFFFLPRNYLNFF
jgi:hypothetical protein